MIVEDSGVNHVVMFQQLSPEGFVASVANHGIEDLEPIRKTSFSTANAEHRNVRPLDAVLCDFELPVTDGLTFAREIRKLQDDVHITGQLPIVAVTANAHEQQKDATVEAVLDTVVTKPFRMPELVREVKSVGATRIPRKGG